MKGIAERDRRAMEKVIAQAWWTSNLDGSKLKPLKHYLDMMKPSTARGSSRTALEVFREYQALGAPITIRHFGPDGKELN